MLHNNSMTLIVHILIGLFHMILQYYTFSNRSILRDTMFCSWFHVANNIMVDIDIRKVCHLEIHFPYFFSLVKSNSRLSVCYDDDDVQNLVFDSFGGLRECSYIYKR